MFLLVLATAINYGQTFTDDFTGLTAGNLATQSGWTKGGSGPDATIDNVTPLTYGGYNGGGGEYVVIPTATSTSSRVFKLFTAPVTAYTGSTFYFSFLLRLTTAGTTSNGYFISLGDAAGSTSALAPKIYATTNGTGYNLGIAKQTTSVANGLVYGTTVLNFNETYLVVIKYTFNTAGTVAPAKFDDEAYLWVNPSLASEPLTSAAECTASVGGSIGAGDPDFDGYNVIAGGVGSFIWHNRGLTNPTGAFDGIRVANGSTSAEAWASLNSATVPVEMTTFSANSINGNVELLWDTATEKNNSGFEVERKLANSEFVKIGFVKGNGTTSEFSSYSFTDKNVNSNSSYAYRLKQIDFNGTFTYSTIVNVSGSTLPSTFALAQNFPNPFNPTTSISYSLPKAGIVSLAIFNTLGQKVKEVVNGFQEAGNYTVSLNASDLSSGNYIYNISLDGQSINKKMLLLK